MDFLGVNMKAKRLISGLLILSLTFATACIDQGSVFAPIPSQDSNAMAAAPSDYSNMTPEEICKTLTLEQKAAQMMQPTIYNTLPGEMEMTDYGSILSRVDNYPMPTAEEWKKTVTEYQTYALLNAAPIPFIYGNDSVHGVNFASGCVMFPHNINIGAANDPKLTEEYGKLAGSDVANTRMMLNFAPCVATANDPRWGRTYESYSSDSKIVKELAVAYTKGLMSEGVLACPKHFFGDGMTAFGTGESTPLDRGDSKLTEEQIKDQLSIYQALIDEGVMVIMLSHSSLNGTKMHENEKYISYLKKDMGFKGIVLTDWDSVMNCSGADYKENVIICVNAGVDMLMTETDHPAAMKYIIEGVNEGRISEDRINDAVTRILRVKKEMGLFDDPYLEKIKPSYEFGSKESHEVARKLAAESFVPLKAGKNMYIKPGMKVLVTGPAADNVGALCGGWTNWWQGESDVNFRNLGFEDKYFRMEGSSIVEALSEAAKEVGFEITTDKTQVDSCDMILLCVGEKPYAEWYGDTNDLSLTGSLGLPGNSDAIQFAAQSGKPVVTLIVAGRNVIIDQYLDEWDSCIMLYLPGTEGGNAVSDVLTGKTGLTGTLPMPYYSSTEQIGTGKCWHDVGWNALKG